MVNKVQDLLFRAEFFDRSHEGLKRSFLKQMPGGALERTHFINTPLGKLTVLNANLYFFEALSCIASLLRDSPRDPTKAEVSLHELAKKLPTHLKGTFQLELAAIFKEYKASGLKDMRDMYVDHKNLDGSGDPTASFINFVADGFAGSCSRVIDLLKKLYADHFPNSVTNNYFSDFYLPGVQFHIGLFGEG